MVECGVFRGFGVMSWAKLSAMLEPENLTRRIYGFDSCRLSVDHRSGRQPDRAARTGSAARRFLRRTAGADRRVRPRSLPGSHRKVHLIKGDVVETIPTFVAEHPHLVVSLLFLDFDLYEPTKAALEHFVPRMPRGAVLAFDELDNPMWPGETLALLRRSAFGTCGSSVWSGILHRVRGARMIIPLTQPAPARLAELADMCTGLRLGSST